MDKKYDAIYVNVTNTQINYTFIYMHIQFSNTCIYTESKINIW